ncbi:zinc dependent phospholipase C family protein [Bacillus salitolerans]|uniref:Zinc dependent phospholipase C family protein n=1 Tax=Bacillus salitolerans TaxID=1437434 RepID=A0ABW4LQE8_9BACI
MATWVTHFRIAEELLKNDIPVSPIEFLVGNIGPDCGLIGENGIPTPPKEITHFEVEGKINANSFYNEYLSDEHESSSRKFSYYLGYYIHLVTDEEWIKLLEQKKREKVYQEILNTPEYSRLVKRDWYGLDFLYLKNHKDNIFWTDFQHITDFPEYLDFFKKGQTLEQIGNITKFYQSSTISDEHEFIYLSAVEVDEFVKDTVQMVTELLNQKLRYN